ncbi:MAG: class I SAM-dependent methyltransferase [Acidobacteria bacterium]|nr:class I SAM-dependent methyltransferase [Acidobacteriota bacterium]
MSLRSTLSSPEGKSTYVRRLFATIADRYDLITILLSYGQDRRWKRRLVARGHLKSGDLVLDAACGTGDIAFECATYGADVVGLDITVRMIELARQKVFEFDTEAAHQRRERERAVVGRGSGGSPERAAPRQTKNALRFLAGDMMALPFPDASFDVVTTGYGLRNVPELSTALDEIARVLRPGGRLLSLDFDRPRNQVLWMIYFSYLTVVGSILGLGLHRDPDAYRYIPESLRTYPGARGVADLMRTHGFADARFEPVLGGLMALHIARK